MNASRLSGKKLLLGVSGSIAAYKAADIASQLVGLGADVRVALTPNAGRFVGAATFRGLTGHTPLTDLFDEVEDKQVAHIALVEDADLYLIAPATANVLGKIAAGIADDIVTTLVLAATCPVVLAPAMNTHMWANPTVIGNVDRLRSLGFHFVDPVEGRLACGMTGAGKLAPPESIVEHVVRLLVEPVEKDWDGVPVLITAGPTREPIDPVRYLSNYSTGQMGYAIAAAAQRRGARVTLITGPAETPIPDVGEVVRVQTAAEMLEAVRKHFPSCRVAIGAAAVSDFSPVRAAHKLKKSDAPGAARTLKLQETTDILGDIGREKGDRVLVGFALETRDLVKNARAKLTAKNLDMIIANSAGDGNEPFGPGPSRVRLISCDGQEVSLPLMSKQEIAEQLLTYIRERFPQAKARH